MAVMKLGRNTILTAGVFAVVIAGITPTLAGFQFKSADTAPAPGTYSQPAPNTNYVSPAANYAQPYAPQQQSAPAYLAPMAMVPQSAMPTPYVTSTSTSISSGAVINWDASTQQMPAQSVQGIEAVPLSPSGRRHMPPASASSPDNVSGFGSDLPLLVALQQVVPQQYKTALSPGVDGGVHVSWQGDRPWEQVLSSMLAPVRLDFVLRGNALVVKQKGSTALPSFPQVASAAAPSGTLTQDSVTGKVKWSDEVSAAPAELSAPAAPQQLAPARHHSKPMAAATPASARAPVAPTPIAIAPAVKAPAPVQEAEVSALPTPVTHHSEAASEVTLPESDDAALPVVAADTAPVKMTPAKSAPAPAPVTTPIPVTATTSTTATASKSAPLETTWHAKQGQTLHDVLEAWTQTAHAQLYWSTDYDYKINADLTYDGSFEEAVSKLLDQFSSAKPQPYGQLHRNSKSGSILVVTTYGTYN